MSEEDQSLEAARAALLARLSSSTTDTDSANAASSTESSNAIHSEQTDASATELPHHSKAGFHPHYNFHPASGNRGNRGSRGRGNRGDRGGRGRGGFKRKRDYQAESNSHFQSSWDGPSNDGEDIEEPEPEPGQPMDAAQLEALERKYGEGRRDERGDLVMFRRSFVEDPWEGMG